MHDNSAACSLLQRFPRDPNRMLVRVHSLPATGMLPTVYFGRADSWTIPSDRIVGPGYTKHIGRLCIFKYVSYSGITTLAMYLGESSLADEQPGGTLQVLSTAEDLGRWRGYVRDDGNGEVGNNRARTKKVAWASVAGLPHLSVPHRLLTFSTTVAACVHEVTLGSYVKQGLNRLPIRGTPLIT